MGNEAESGSGDHVGGQTADETAEVVDLAQAPPPDTSNDEAIAKSLAAGGSLPAAASASLAASAAIGRACASMLLVLV